MALVSSSTSNQYNRRVVTLPRIEHPSKLINSNDQSQLDIRGKSRNGSGNGQLIRSECSTPDLSSRNQRRRRSSSVKNSFQYSNPPAQSLTQIPEHIPIVYGEDRDKVRLPVFGNRPSSTTSSYRLESGKTSPTTKRIIVDELETILKEKVRSQIHDIRTKFRHAQDYDSNGKISKEAFQHLIASIFGTQKQISPYEIDQLLQRLQLKHLQKISFDEFLNSLFDSEDQLPSWVSRQASAQSTDYSAKKTASQIFFILKEKYRTKDDDLAKICPSLNGGEATRIFKAQFHNVLIDIGYRMNDKEFDKLWDKFDTDGFHAISEEKFLKRLANEETSLKVAPIPRSETQDQQSAILRSSVVRSSQSSSRTPRLHTARTQLDEEQIRIWLNHKFPQGFSQLEQTLEKLDFNQTGFISEDILLNQLKQFGITFETNLFEFFLKRLNIDLNSYNKTVPYKQLIQLFQLLIYQSNKSKHQTIEQNRQSALEKQVECLVERYSDEIDEKISKYDRSNGGTVNSNDMRLFIEDLLGYPLRPDEFYHLIKKFPLDENGNILYRKYFQSILQKAKQAKDASNDNKSPLIPQWDYMRSKQIRESLDQEHLSKKKKGKDSLSTDDDQHKPRPVEQLRDILQNIVRDRYKDIEEQFQKLDRSSYGELTQDLLYQLFQNLSIKPMITRGEIVLLWSRCYLKENGNLDFYQFLREFGYKKHEAHFPNAKQNPPKKGDSDFLLTSRKLYADSVLVHGTALNAIKSNWDQLRQEFVQLDPYRTGFIDREEFDEILYELCPQVNQEDLDGFKLKFQTKNDSRINYVQFLKSNTPFHDFVEDVQQNTSTNKNNQSDHSNDLKKKIQVKLGDSLKELRRKLKEKDLNNNGTISIHQFKQILNQFHCHLNDEEFYQLSSQLDTNINGNINYNYFIQQFIKTN